MNDGRRRAAWAAMVWTVVAGVASAESVHWPSFRGTDASGVADCSTPAEWSVETGANVAWKTHIPGLALSAPAIWGDRVFVTTAVAENPDPELKDGLYGSITPVDEDTPHSFRLYCLNKKTGSILWEREAYKGVPKVKRHPKSSHANCTPATDGKRVVAFFGSEGLYCFDLDGKPLWQKDLGLLDSGYYVVPGAQWGFAASPIIHGDKVIVQCDVQKDSFLAAYSLTSGEQIWRTPRDEVPTWSTPTVHTSDGRTQIIVNGYKHIGGYDLETGAELWKMRGGGDIPVPTPVVSDGLIYISNAHGGGAPIYAIRTSAAGDITLAEGEKSNEHIAWSYPRRGTYMQTLLVYDGLLYACKDNGILTVYDAKSGKKHYSKRLGDGSTGFTASPVAADGKVYFTSEEGDVHVVKAGVEFNLLATNPLGELCMASPAISEGVLFFHAYRHVFAIGRSD